MISAVSRLDSSGVIRFLAASASMARPTAASPLSSRMQVPGEQQGQLPGHQPGADDAHLADRAGQREVGGADRLAGTLLHQVERVHPGPELLGHDQVDQRLALGRQPVGQFGGPGQCDHLQRPVRRGGGAVRTQVGDDLAAFQGRAPFIVGRTMELVARHRDRAVKYAG